MSHIRFVNDSLVGHNCRAFYVASDGTETEISSVIQGADIHIAVGQTTTATLYGVKVKADVHADAEIPEAE